MAYDVVAVNINKNTVRILARSESLANAEAFIVMAVARRGVGEEFFSEVLSGTYADGDKWQGGQL